MDNTLKGYYLIAMLDILGFKKMAEKHRLGRIHNIMQRLFSSSRVGTHRDLQIQIGLHGSKPAVASRTPMVRLNYFIFSDTILVWKYISANKMEETSESGKTEFMLFNAGTGRIIEETIKREIPLRGAIAFGECIICIDTQGKDNEIIGQPIIDAYLLGEAQDWVGIAFHSSCLPFIKTKHDPRVKQYNNIPCIQERISKISHGTKTNYSLEWGGQDCVKDIIKQTITKLKRRGESESIIRKYENTFKFIKNHKVYLV